MTLEEAKQLLDEEYERAKMIDYVINPLAYALYQVWKKVDTKNGCTKSIKNKGEVYKCQRRLNMHKMGYEKCILKKIVTAAGNVLTA